MAEENCKVCGHSYILTETFCPKCGFERHIFPAPVSKEVEEYEKKRVEEYKGRWEQAQEQKEEIEKLNSDLQTAKDKSVVDKQELEKLRINLEEATHQTSAIAKEKERELSESSKKNEELKRQISQLESAAKIVEAQRKDLVEKLTKANDSFTKEVEDHKRTKKKLERLLNAAGPVHVEPKPMPRPQPRQNPPQPQGQPVAKIIFSCGTQTVQENVFDGNNSYAIPSSMNSPVSGDVFRIESVNGKVFRLYDLCGLTCKVDGDKIRTTGIQLYDKDYFSVGQITIQIKLPKMNLRDLLK